MTTRLAVFDCDGTLVDGQAAVCTAMARAFDAAGVPQPDSHAVRRIVGLSLPQAVMKLAPDLPSAQRGDVVEAYKTAFREARMDGSLREPLYPGIRELVEALKAHGWALAVATGKSDRGLEATLATHRLSGHFTSLHTASRHPSKPYPAMLEACMEDEAAAPAATVMIGDTTYDIMMARHAGVRAIGVAWGYHAPEELLSAGAEAVARDSAHLQELILG
ncbi:HAD-IA family hydrolase [Paraurantiacibacter namhicola]|uniref:5'-nucleotidase n=1 Tax=Paraurantiacibacter namhicola TaxID=645517 RepID=A0A1C7DAW3_9SPHN|nr:HAD-IA family hydrolase [Paraurantiacibacter namhicola]ANU08626.1 5'-nucleotidase [Paraurantiacibacter namhicola]